jgi:hypothetical protein
MLVPVGCREPGRVVAAAAVGIVAAEAAAEAAAEGDNAEAAAEGDIAEAAAGVAEAAADIAGVAAAGVGCRGRLVVEDSPTVWGQAVGVFGGMVPGWFGGKPGMGLRRQPS